MPTGEIEFDSIERIFAQRDARLAAEAQEEVRRQNASGHKPDSRSKSSHGDSSRSGASARSNGVRGVNPRTSKRLPEGSNKVCLERTPKQDEYKAVRRTKNSTHAASSKTSGSKKHHAKRNDTDSMKVGLLGSIAGIASAVLLAIGVASSPSPAQSAVGATNSQKTDLYSGVSSYIDNYEGDIIDIKEMSDGDYVIDFDEQTINADEDINTEDIAETAEIPEVSAEHVTDNMLEALKGWEHFEPNAYFCPSNKLTIGWGHTDGVYEGQTTTREEAGEFLKEDIIYSENVVKDYADKFDVTLTQGQLDALTSFAFNCGEGNFRNSGLIETLAAEGVDATAELMKKYVYGKKDGESVLMPGLVTRRETEASWLYD